MPTDSSGVHSLPPGYLAQTGETIQASQHNPPLEDLSTAMTGRLPRSGAAPMTGPLKLTDGTVGSPSLAFNNAATTGIYKTTTGFGLVVGGALVAEINTSGLVMAKTALFKDGGDTASAGALTLGDGNIFNITGTISITSIATKGIGAVVMLRFAGVLTLTHNATDLILSGAANITTAAGDWAIFEEYATGDWRMISYHRTDGRALKSSLPRGYIDGGKITNSVTDATNDINISECVCRDITNTTDIIGPALTGKQLDANWTAGSAAGMRYSGAGITDGSYGLFLARTVTSDVGDIYAYPLTAGTDADSTAFHATVLAALQAETGGASYAYLRRIGCIIRSTSILPISQFGDEVLFTTVPATNGTNGLGTSPSNFATAVPVGVRVTGIYNISVDHASAAAAVYVYSLDQADQAVTDSVAPLGTARRWSGGRGYAANQRIRTNTAAQVRAVSDTSSTDIRIATLGYVDYRGKDA